MSNLKQQRLARVVFAVLGLVALNSWALSAEPDYHARRVRLAEKLKGGTAVLFAAAPPRSSLLEYRQDSDFFYLTGWTQPGAAILVQDTKPYREILFLPERNLHSELFTGEKMDAATPNAASKAHVDEVRPMTDLPALLGESIKNFYGQTDSATTRSMLNWVATTRGSDSPPAINNASTLVGELRAIKDAVEVALLTRASQASAVAQNALRKSIDSGVTERAAAGAFLQALLKEGCTRPSYPPIIGSGANSTVLHYEENSETMHAGDVIVVDAAAECDMYASDITRTWPVSGQFSPRQREIYEIVLGAQQAAIDGFVAGKSRINDPKHKYEDSLDTIAFNYMNAHSKDIGKYFVHGIGHSVGIDVHDPYDYSKPIEKGMVITIEPGIYIPSEKIGVRIEDTFYVNDEGKLINLTSGVPKSLPPARDAHR